MKTLIEFFRGPSLDLKTHKTSISTIRALEINDRNFNIMSGLVTIFLFFLGCSCATNYYKLDLFEGMISNSGIQSTAAITFLYGLWKTEAFFFNRNKIFTGLEETIKSNENSEPVLDHPLDKELIKNVVDDLVDSKLNEESK